MPPLLVLLSIILNYWAFLFISIILIPSKLCLAEYLNLKYHISSSLSDLNENKQNYLMLNCEKSLMFCEHAGLCPVSQVWTNSNGRVLS